MSTERDSELHKNQKNGITPERRKRINRLKKLIVRTVVLLILIPFTGCIILGIKLYRTNKKAEAAAEKLQFAERALQESSDERDRAQELLRINEEIWQKDLAEQKSAELPEVEEVSGNDIETEEETRKVYLTFDDGPSIYTGELLDILAEYDVKATFFVTGKGKESYGDIYRRITEEGHTLGMHSYSHEYTNIYASLDNFRSDMEYLRDFLYDETGVVSNVYRFPGGSSNQVSRTDIHEMTAYLNAMGIRYFDWNISAGDATSAAVSSEQIVDRVMSELPSRKVAVILMHDAADKHSTVEALPSLIEEIQAMGDGTEILPITEETMLIQHVAE